MKYISYYSSEIYFIILKRYIEVYFIIYLLIIKKMPRRDWTWPEGKGPNTWRWMGNCWWNNGTNQNGK